MTFEQAIAAAMAVIMAVCLLSWRIDAWLHRDDNSLPAQAARLARRQK